MIRGINGGTAAKIGEAANAATWGAPFATMIDSQTWVWACHACDWTMTVQDPEPVEHRCGRGPCKHLGERCGSVKLECCGGAIKYPYYQCAIHRYAVPAFRPGPDWPSHLPESATFTPCLTCEDFCDDRERTAAVP